MISVEELFKSNKYPKWITSNPIFSKLEHVRKIFPTIGLPNFEDKITIDNSKEINTFASQLLDKIADLLVVRTQELERFAKKSKIGKKRRQNLAFILSVMKTLNGQLRDSKSLFTSITESGKASISIPSDIIYNDEVFMKKGAGLFKIYSKLNSLLKENKFIELPDLSKTYQFKNFSSINIPSKETMLKFSADGADGAWDIATMSMRGINSCQTWEEGVGNSVKVIGSIIDPFTAIIYMTTGGYFNQYGCKMMRRCIVRYVINHNSKEPFILLEKMYPAFDQPSLDSFVKAIKSRVPDINVKYSVDMGSRANVFASELSRVYVPLSDELKMLDQVYYPYCDSALSFKEDANCKLSKNTFALHSSFKKQIPNLFKKAIASRAFTKENVKKYGSMASDMMSQLRSKKIKEKATDSIADLSNRFVEYICKKTEDKNPFKFLSEHERECESFFETEFGEKTDSKFAKFVSSNVCNYIDDKTKC